MWNGEILGNNGGLYFLVCSTIIHIMNSSMLMLSWYWSLKSLMTKMWKTFGCGLHTSSITSQAIILLEGGLKKLALSTRKISIFHTLALYLKGSLLFFGVLGPYLYFRFPIFSVWASFTLRMSIQSACAVTTIELTGKFWFFPMLMRWIS